MFYYTYKVTLLKGSLAGKYYYGQHRTKKLEDGYIGSGTKIAAYFKTYPKVEGVTYVREILAFYSDEEELNRAEKELVGDRYETDPNCLNLKAGGNQAKLSSEARLKRSLAARGKAHPWNKGKKHKPLSSESKQKISNTLKALPPRKWVNNGKELHLVPETLVPEYLEKGFILGKKID